MSLTDRIFEKELDTIEYYIDRYATGKRKASVRKILSHWDRYKSAYLADLFDGELILEKDVVVEVPNENLKKQMADFIKNNSFLISLFEHPDVAITRGVKGIFFHTAYYVENKISLYQWDQDKFFVKGNPIKIYNGSKPIKLIGKIAHILGMEEEFEAFRLEHSRMLNTKTLKGKLCLSIHPLDFMTMSDNDSNWSSCMSWNAYGCYRQGTVEMMTSPCVLMAYLKGSTNMKIGEYEWNNKKWRQLFIVDPSCIMNIKAYPYRSDELTREAISWIHDLVTTHKDWKYQDLDEDYEYCSNKVDTFECDTMYNDIDNDSEYPRMLYRGADEIHINYSGPFVCMRCGESTWPADTDEGVLVCEDCAMVYRCYECNEELEPEDGLYEIDGCYYCENCYNKLHIDIFTHNRIANYSTTEINIISGDRVLRKIYFSKHSRESLDKVTECFTRSQTIFKVHSVYNGIPYIAPITEDTMRVIYVDEKDLTDYGREVISHGRKCDFPIPEELTKNLKVAKNVDFFKMLTWFGSYHTLELNLVTDESFIIETGGIIPPFLTWKFTIDIL